MFNFFLSSTKSVDLKPLILIPGLYGSPLYGQADKNYDTHWYCPSFKNRGKFWVDLKMVIPPVYNCLFECMTVRYDAATDGFKSQPGFNVGIEDWGGSGGIEYVDSSFFNWHFIESFHSFADFLREKGYEFKKNLFGCPYDWRMGMAGFEPMGLFGKIKQLVEQAYNINGNQKVTLLGYSLGGYVSQHFLAEYLKDQPDWKAQYIRKVVFLAPAFGGSGDTLVPAWNHRFPLVSFLSSDAIETCLSTMPVLHALFPNHIVFGDKAVAIGPDGTKYTAAQWGQLLIDHGKLSGEGKSNYLKNVWFNKHELKDPGVPVYIIYNSQVETDFTLNFKKGFDKDPEIATVGGDGTVPADGILYVLKHWDIKSHAVIGYDYAKNDKDFNHGGLGKLDEVAQKIYEAATDQWEVTYKEGLIVKKAPHYECTEGKCVARNDIREATEEVFDEVSRAKFIEEEEKRLEKVQGVRILEPMP